MSKIETINAAQAVSLKERLYQRKKEPNNKGRD